jgi:NAD(P)-dependent dehydrogenase (short-subunit alcohol dehydrogenase family)
MAAASDRVVTVFGGTGFLGRRIVRHLRLHGFCVPVASRHPDRGHALLPPDDPQLRSIKADVHDERSVAEALADACGAVNAVSLYVDTDGRRFIPTTSSLPNGSRLRRSERESNGSSMFRGLGPNSRKPRFLTRPSFIRYRSAARFVVAPALFFPPNSFFESVARQSHRANHWRRSNQKPLS